MLRETIFKQIGLCFVIDCESPHRWQVDAREETHRNLWMVRTGNQTGERLKARHVTERQFQEHTIDPLGLAKGKPCGSCVGFENSK
jgi:hypothetical protein